MVLALWSRHSLPRKSSNAACLRVGGFSEYQMIIWMIHAQHGRHPAQGHEIEALKAQGWEIMPPKQRQEAAPEVVVQQEPEEPRQKRKYTRRAV